MRFWYLVMIAIFSLLTCDVYATHSPARQTYLDKLEALLIGGRHRTALAYADSILAELPEAEQVASAYGLTVRYYQAEILERDNKYDLALGKFIELIAHAREQGAWGVLIQARLSLARMYEKVDRQEDTRRELDLAYALINKYEIPAAMPRYLVRMSSYERIFGQKARAKELAQEAQALARQYGDDFQYKTAVLLLGLLTPLDDPVQAMAYHREFADYAMGSKKYPNYYEYSFSLLNIAEGHLRIGDLDRAAVCYDSVLLVATVLQSLGLNYEYQSARSMEKKSAIFYRQQRHDSARYYLLRSHEMQLAAERNVQLDKIAEVESRYRTKEQADVISQQQKDLYQAEWRYRSVAIGLGTLAALLGVLVYLYLRLRDAKRDTDRQAHTITTQNEQLTTTLEQQQLLQGELHHRVKNNLQIILSLIELQQERIAQPEVNDSLQAMSSRIYSIAAVHEIMYLDEHLERCSHVRQYVDRLSHHLTQLADRPEQVHVATHIEAVELPISVLTPIGIMLNELITNSLKYADVQGDLQLDIALARLDPDRYELCYRDNGVGYPEGEIVQRDKGLGTYLLNSMARQLDGTLTTYNDEGAVCRLVFRMSTTTL